jgi:hypothetical protein
VAGACQLLICHLLFPEPPGLHAPGFRHLSATSHARHDVRGRALKRRFCGHVPRPQCLPLDFGASPSRAAPAAQLQPVAPEAERGTLRPRNVPFEGNLGGSDAECVMRSGSSQVVQPRGTSPRGVTLFWQSQMAGGVYQGPRSVAGTTWAATWLPCRKNSILSWTSWLRNTSSIYPLTRTQMSSCLRASLVGTHPQPRLRSSVDMLLTIPACLSPRCPARAGYRSAGRGT